MPRFRGKVLPQTVSAQDRAGLKVLAEKTKLMGVRLPPLCACGTDHFDPLYVGKSGQWPDVHVHWATRYLSLLPNFCDDHSHPQHTFSRALCAAHGLLTTCCAAEKCASNCPLYNRADVWEQLMQNLLESEAVLG